MVEVFKTNVEEPACAREMVTLLLLHFPGSRINFDLDDCDKVLRVEGKDFISGKVIMLMNENGFACSVLD